jgi:hypothetical protein
MPDWRDRVDARTFYLVTELFHANPRLGVVLLRELERLYPSCPQQCEVAGCDPSIAGPAFLEPLPRRRA